MILNLSIFNYGPIRKQLRITSPFMRSFRIPSDMKSDDLDGDPKYFRKSRLICLIGDNGCGKTTVLKAIKYLSILFKNGAESASLIRPMPLHALESETNVGFSVDFLANNTKYRYLVSVRDNIIKEERLFFCPHVKQALLYTRKLDENGSTILSFGDSLRMTPGEKNILKVMLSKDKTLLQSYSDLTFHKPALKTAWDYLSQQLCYPSIINAMDSMNFTAKKFVSILPELLDVSRKMEEQGICPDGTTVNFLLSMRQVATACPDTPSGNIEFRQSLGRHLRILSSGESEFILSLFSMVAANDNNGVCVLDDFADKMDPNRAMALLDYFLSKNRCSQLIFTTHCPTLLDYDSLSREQIVFLFRDADGSISADQKLAKSIHKTISLANSYSRGWKPKTNEQQ